MPSETETPVRIIVIMGVAGCGKTSVGQSLGGQAGVPFLDGDDFHPPENVAKMSAGTPLTDEDRWPWLEKLASALSVTADVNGRVYAACSALRRAYRDRMRDAAGEAILFVHLDGSREVIGARIGARQDHYMPPALLDSQFATLEPPEPDERACRVPVDGSFEDVVQAAASAVRDHLPKMRTSEF